MSIEQYQNNYTTTLNGAINNSVTTITVTAAPTAIVANFRIKIDDEIIFVGAVSGNDLTNCVRASEGTSAASHSNGATVRGILTAGGLRAYGRHMDPMAARGSLYDGFDTTDTSPPIAPWTTLGSPDTLTANNTTSVSQLYVAESGAGSVNLAGAYQTWSPSNGNYVETWLTDFTLSSSLSSYVGIFVGEAGGTGKFSFLGIGRYAAAYDDRAVIFQYTSRTAFGSETGSVAGPWRGPVGLRLVYNSSTSMDYWLTTGGLGWRRLVTGTNIGFTVGIAGIGGDMSASSFTTEAWFEYFNNG